jgi:hypothetical protein
MRVYKFAIFDGIKHGIKCGNKRKSQIPGLNKGLKKIGGTKAGLNAGRNSKSGGKK